MFLCVCVHPINILLHNFTFALLFCMYFQLHDEHKLFSKLFLFSFGVIQGHIPTLWDVWWTCLEKAKMGCNL